ncbi:sensor histidine kinase [Streptomyces sp. NBC_01618]|uniref:sensor histidine kinase n=1 Tax=Streptomyces sp. NBC_01618 TaxID=2975900 RepID=UPI00386F687A|nr:histidine kinase [Streptomyces sp. NBC_01618]
MSAASVLNLVATGHSHGEVVLQGTFLLGILSVQILHCAPSRYRWSLRNRRWILIVQCGLTYVPFLYLGDSWVGMPGFLAGSLLLTPSGPLSWVLSALVPGSMLVISTAFGHTPLQTAHYVLCTLLTGMIVFGLTRLSDMVEAVQAVQAAQAEMARMAVARERLRFARDLHDLLGYSLSAIILRSELTFRLVDTFPDRARDEIAAVLEISRRALADVRQVARGYRNMSLTDEAASAKSVLEAVGVAATIKLSCDELPGQVSTVLATVLREGMTNVLRHSKVRHCGIWIWAKDESVRMAIVNDGVTAGLNPRDGAMHSGSGLGNLSLRLSEIGGRLEAGVGDDGQFHLVAVVPLRLGEVGREAVAGRVERRGRLVEEKGSAA